MIIEIYFIINIRHQPRVAVAAAAVLSIVRYVGYESRQLCLSGFVISPNHGCNLLILLEKILLFLSKYVLLLHCATIYSK